MIFISYIHVTADDIPETGSGSGSGSGGGLFGASCVEAEFTTCCTGSASTCTVGPPAIECSCSQDCFSVDTCCHDITEVPCFPGIATLRLLVYSYMGVYNCVISTEISISFTESSITVEEGDLLAMLTITVSGFPDDPLAFRVPVEAFILLYTGDGSAQGRH